jgi:CDP-diacylglycerol---glycerol-3-phosphate 3-phosphatidyltransferase
MLNQLRSRLDRVVTPVARTLARAGITPNVITVTGSVGVCAGALGLFPTGHLFIGTLVCTAFVFSDLIDGTLARITGSAGRWGAFLDSTMDRITEAAVFGGLILWFFRGGHDPLLAGVALFCLVAGALVSYVKARAEGLGLSADVGIAAHAEKLVITLLSAGLAGLGVPYILAIGLWLLAGLSVVTFGQRVAVIYRGARQGTSEGTGGDVPDSPSGGTSGGTERSAVKQQGSQ